MIITVSIITLLITLCVNCLIALRSDVKRNYRKKKKRKKAPDAYSRKMRYSLFMLCF